MIRLTSDAAVAALFAGAIVLGGVIRALAKLVERPKSASPDKESDVQHRRSR
ncbi:hypothetical protein SAMN02799620_04366 [Mycolicibacterium fluoranthenivorans]|jgi:hypothetical protein|uniref:Uncharacterized protein n=1 Tax=Mycolicibacterium fluoranthenivorans TaxID=258505 RepID=A0A1G4WQR5_9MYCO|nr:hypothetical protein SAMN02799620_04366 [Mycolicibacterium fluoranthenivorans]